MAKRFAAEIARLVAVLGVDGALEAVESVRPLWRMEARDQSGWPGKMAMLRAAAARALERKSGRR